MAATCETCRWWGGKVTNRVYVRGTCRRYPPISREHNRPIMDLTDFCGEHQPKEPTP